MKALESAERAGGRMGGRSVEWKDAESFEMNGKRLNWRGGFFEIF